MSLKDIGICSDNKSEVVYYVRDFPDPVCLYLCESRLSFHRLRALHEPR